MIIPSLNSARWLGAQLDALAAQDYPGQFEVVVADNGSSDSSPQLVRDRTDLGHDVRLVEAAARRGPGAARNAGARAARGEFLAFCDADDVVSPQWLHLLVNSARETDVVGGRFEADLLNSGWARRCFEVDDPYVPHLGFLPTASGASLGVWKEVFDSLGGFDESSRTGEDVDLVWRAQLGGRRYAASPALVHKRLPRRRADAVRRFFFYGQGDAWLYRRFAASGMPRRGFRETLTLWYGLATGFRGAPRERRWGVWLIVLALSAGRLVGSVRSRVIFA